MAPVLICVLLLLFLDVSPGGTLEVELSPGEELFQLGSKVQFNCTVKNASESSFDVTWYFKKCNKLPYTYNECERNHFQQINIKKSNTYRRDNIFIIEHLVEGSGILRCGVNSSNVDERINATRKFFVTDINSTKVLNVWGRPSEIVPGDTFTLTCANNMFLGGSQPTWIRTEREMPKNGTWVGLYTEIEVEANSEGLRVEANSSTYTYYTNLTFMNISRQHEGLYTCDGGYYFEKVLIFVKDPEQPKITYTNLKTLEQKGVKPQSNLTIFCRTQGLPKPKVRWYKDGEPLVINETVKLKEANQVLEIQGVQVTHKGVYVCVAKNRFGEVNATGNLFTTDVFLKPIIKGSTSKIILEGDDLELQCVAYAESGKQFNISWIVPENLKNSSSSHKTCQQNISLSCSTALLKIYNAKVNYTGEYTCVVRDNKTLNNDSVVVTVVGKDETSIILQSNSPQKRVFELREALTIEVNITASMPVELEWYRPRGIVLRPGETDDDINANFSLSHNPDVATLTVEFLFRIDTGQYSLHAYHAFNSTWYNITVAVLDSPDITVNGYDEKLFTLGLKVNLTCSVGSLTPVDISWQFLECDVEELFDWDEIGWPYPEYWHESCNVYTKDACNASHGCHEIISEYYNISQETYEAIGEFHVQREGLLICIANNSEHRRFHARHVYISEFSNMSAPLQIWGAPTEVVMGDTFNLTCVATSYLHKSLTWYWYHGDQEIKLQSNTSGLLVVSAESKYTRFSHLQFVNISKQQEGMYTCKEEFNELSTEAFEFIHVKDSAAPQITETNLNETGMKVEYGRNFTIYCYSQGMPTPETLWSKNNESLTIDTEMELGDRNQTLSIKHVKREQEGKYRCEVRNRLGSVEKEGELTTDAVAPEINETNLNINKKLEGYVGNYIYFYCRSQGNPMPVTLWFKDGSPIVTNATVKLTSSNSTLELHDLKMTQRGKYRCEVSNELNIIKPTYAEGILIVTGEQKCSN